MINKTILLVEDNPDDVELTLRAFRQNNILSKIFVARDGVEAVDFLTAAGVKRGGSLSHAYPAVTLLDLKLPRLNGLDVLKFIRSNEHTRLLPVVILTSSKEETDLIEGYKLGANSYIRKPVDFKAFIEAVKLLGLYWLVWNETAPCRAK